MHSYSLNIAGYIIKVESTDGTEIFPSARFLKYIYNADHFDFLIRVHSEEYELPENAYKVFNAPYVEEINGIRFRKKENFWSIWRDKNNIYIKTALPLSGAESDAILALSLKTIEWDLWFKGNGPLSDPMEYPIDSLILYYITVISGDIFIHASGVNYNGKGYLFSGISGKGKSTIARIYDNVGAKIIHDDRIIIRKTDEGYSIFNTPIYNDDKPSESPLNKIFIIDHGLQNSLKHFNNAEAVSRVISNCIQHNWSPEIISKTLNSVTGICKIVPVSLFCFKPDESAVKYLLENE
jgi:hypothetical protein